jgi:hypothetical protein
MGMEESRGHWHWAQGTEVLTQRLAVAEAFATQSLAEAYRRNP